MQKPRRLKKGDKIAIVSLSWGGLGDPEFYHKYEIAKERLENEFGLEVITMPHALKGSRFVAEHPDLRARDLMDAFRDSSIAAVFSAIGGDDSIRMLPYIDYDVLRQNPKIFLGYSDTTVSHFILRKAGIVSFYGPSIMNEFGEYGSMFAYTQNAVRDILFSDSRGYEYMSSPFWSDEYTPWCEENRNHQKKMRLEEHGYEVLQGEGTVSGPLLGGCLDVLMMLNGTSVWPSLEEWKDAILFLETSEDKPSPQFVKYTLRNLAAQGILKVIKGILVGKPQQEVYYEEYKETFLQVISGEEKLTGLPVFYNVNFGHASPIGILPYGIQTELNCKEKKITFLESATAAE